MSAANEDKTTGDIKEMGRRLAEEVTAFLRKKMDKASKSGGYRNIKLSFVGHSIRNIIISSALAGMNRLTFCSFFPFVIWYVQYIHCFCCAISSVYLP